MNILWYRFLGWFYGTFLGGLFFEFLLWVDRRKERKHFLNYKEVAQIVREYSLLDEGMKQIKSKVNSLIVTKSADEYNKLLLEIEDMVTLAERDTNHPKSQLADLLRDMYTKKGNQDIVTLTDRAKMVDKRINDMKELQQDKLKRQLLRKIRKFRIEGNTEEVEKLEQEFKEKYGRTNTRLK